jgi:hypothetical protein
MKLTPENKEHIDGQSYTQLLSRWRNAPIGDPWFQGETGEYWGKRMTELRDAPGCDAAHVSASKAIGWGKTVNQLILNQCFAPMAGVNYLVRCNDQWSVALYLDGFFIDEHEVKPDSVYHLNGGGQQGMTSLFLNKCETTVLGAQYLCLFEDRGLCVEYGTPGLINLCIHAYCLKLAEPHRKKLILNQVTDIAIDPNGDGHTSIWYFCIWDDGCNICYRGRDGYWYGQGGYCISLKQPVMICEMPTDLKN